MFLVQRALIIVAAILALCSAAAADVPLMSADEAHARAQTGELIIVDIRTEAEWRQSGVAEGAVGLTMQDPAFLPKLRALIDRNPDKPIAMICAAGNRSKAVTTKLDQLGIQNLFNISEGMFGSDAGAGWLKRGLPVVKP